MGRVNVELRSDCQIALAEVRERLDALEKWRMRWLLAGESYVPPQPLPGSAQLKPATITEHLYMQTREEMEKKLRGLENDIEQALSDKTDGNLNPYALALRMKFVNSLREAGWLSGEEVRELKNRQEELVREQMDAEKERDVLAAENIRLNKVLDHVQSAVMEVSAEIS